MLLMIVEFLVCSAESGSEGSSDASDENANQQVSVYISGIPVVIVAVLNHLIGKAKQTHSFLAAPYGKLVGISISTFFF